MSSKKEQEQEIIHRIDLMKIDPDIALIMPSAAIFEKIHGRKPKWMIDREIKKEAERLQKDIKARKVNLQHHRQQHNVEKITLDKPKKDQQGTAPEDSQEI